MSSDSVIAASDAASTAATAAAAASTRSTPSLILKAAQFTSINKESNSPVWALFEGAAGVIVAVWNLTTTLIAFSTITIPSAVYNIVHYSLTFTLNFSSLVVIFLAALAAGFIWLRYRHLNRYERLREVPLEKDEGFNLHPDVNSSFFEDDYYDGSRGRGRGGLGGGTFHNYLDDFLQAIRIFGFLEKPVFHELARHLQTKRLIAGDSLSLDADFSFYIVIDGNVQVYAPLPGGPAPSGTYAPNASSSENEQDEEGLSGYQLLHEVQSGGTLSSLFTILSLFTEDVKLGFNDDDHGGLNASVGDSFASSRSAHGGMSSSQAQAQAHAQAIRSKMPAGLATPPHPPLMHPPASQSSPIHARNSLAPGGAGGMANAPGITTPGGSEAPFLEMPPAEANAPFPHFAHPTQSRANSSGSPYGIARAFPDAPLTSAPRTPASVLSAMNPAPFAAGVPVSTGSSTNGNHHQHPHNVTSHESDAAEVRRNSAGAHAFLRNAAGFGAGANGGIRHGDRDHSPKGMQFEGVGTVARATVDTTLAVIPAEAFKRLTRKYPNAAAHIVQVILTRLSRVTLHTTHKYLGLTKEVMQTEKALNQIASAPLPSTFYESGGMEKLRQRFVDTPHKRAANGGASSTAQNSSTKRASFYESDDDYFRHQSERVADGSTNKSAATTVMDFIESPADTEATSTQTGRGQAPSTASTSDPTDPPHPPQRPRTPWGHPDPPTRTPVSRRSVGPGDLFSTPGIEENRSWSYSGGANSALNTPRVVSKSMLKGKLSKIDDSQQGSDAPQGSSKDRPRRESTISERKEVLTEDEEIGWASVGLADFDLKDAVMTCIANCIGLTQASVSPVMSVQASPFISAQDVLLQRSVFNSAFSPLSMLDAAGYDGESSVTGGSNSHAGHFPPELENDVQIRFFEAKSLLVKAGEMQAGLFYVIDGFLDVVIPPPKHEPQSSNQSDKQKTAEKRETSSGPSSDAKPIYTVGRGGVAGYLSTLLGTSSYVDITARTDCYVGFLPAHAIEKMMERRPTVLLTLCKRLLGLLTPLLLHIDSALDWQQVNAGQIIYRQGDPSDSFYIVINGRLRAISERSDGKSGFQINSEFGQGNSVGELDVVTSTPRTMTLHAIRDSELAKMPMTLFNAISVRHPSVTIQMSKIIASRVRAEISDKHRSSTAPLAPGVPDLGRNNANLKTIAILPVTRDVPITAFASRLQSAFEDTIGQPAAYLNQSRVMGVLGRHAFNRMGKLKLAGWLADQEERYRLVFYVVDTAVSSPWAQTSIRQADCILVVGFGDDPSMGEFERLLLSIKTTARKELVLLHPERMVQPGSTRAWLKSRPWVHAHHHVEMPGIPRMQSMPSTDPKAVKALKNLRRRIGTQIQQYRERRDGTVVSRSHHFSDFARLARRLCGKSIGLVLGGGGARGCAHVGVLRALEERGIPIDIIGGTSIGSFVGGLYAREAGLVPSLGRAKKFAGRMASLWRFAIDLTYPYVSYTTGHEFNRGIFKAFLDTHIEDFWLPFFCNTTNITWSKMEIHTTGYAWRYIRGSMTLAGLIPPLIDGGDMLVDGGYTDNLPVSVILSMGADSVFAVDVGSIDDTLPRSYGDTLSGWWVLLNRWNPWSDAIMIPSIPEIQGRLTYVSSVKMLEDTKALPGCFYMRMPVEKFGTLEFGKFNEIEEIGYRTACKLLNEWEAAGALPTGEVIVEPDQPAFGLRRKGGISARRNSV